VKAGEKALPKKKAEEGLSLEEGKRIDEKAYNFMVVLKARK